MCAHVTYRSPRGKVSKVVVTSFSYAAFNITKSTQYGQTGLVCGIPFVNDGPGDDVYYLINWASMKKNPVYYISYDVYMLSCTDGHDRRYNIKIS